MDKVRARIRRAKKTRLNIREAGKTRLCIHRTPKHIYAQVIDSDAKVLAAASTVEAELRTSFGGNVAAAKVVGALVAKRALEKGIDAVAFDRSGFAYHGRVAALADAAREAGLKF